MKWSTKWEGGENFIWDGSMGSVWMHIYKNKKTKTFSLSSNLICQALKSTDIRHAKTEAENLVVAALQKSLQSRTLPWAVRYGWMRDLE